MLELSLICLVRNETDKTDDILDSIEELLKQIPSDNSYCILKMSAGSGFHSITGDWQFDDYTKAPLDRKRVREGKVNPKSRKIAVLKNQLSLMGFVKLTAKTEEQLKQEEAERAKQEEAKRQVAIEAERQQKEVEEKAKREKERYEQLMNEGKQLAEQTEYEKALACYKEAQAISDNTEIQHLIADVDLKLSIIANQKHEEEARQKANAVPLAEKIANAQKLPTLYGNVKQWMKQNGRDSLTDEEINALRNQIERIVNTMKTRDKQKMKNLGSELESFISSDLAQCWFNEIVTP